MAKTTRGVLRYSPHESIGLIDTQTAGKTAQEMMGTGGDAPIRATLREFLDSAQRPDTLVIGITPVGGRLPDNMRAIVLEALNEGLEVWSGLHQFLNEDDEMMSAAAISGARIWDVRRPPRVMPVGGGLAANCKSYTCLTVGSDCAVGKMTASLEVQLEGNSRGQKHEFVATGQTGMMISGWGHPIDAIPGDFMAGCVEKDCMSVDGQCDVIHIEGQGSLYHLGFSSVTLALMHGAMPDGFILVHQPSRISISNRDHIIIPPLDEVAQFYLDVMARSKPTKFLGVALNTFGMDDASARAALEDAARVTGVPATDASRYGAGVLVDAIDAHRKQIGK
jgi:uncharacterized NAD-dependent epimerase/dehydratase family protein